MLTRSTPLVAVLLAAAIVGLSGCGSAHDGVILRVGATAVDQSELAHTMALLAPGHAVPDPPHYSACIAHRKELVQEGEEAVLAEECKQEYQALRHQALEYVITSQWLIGEAVERGLLPASAASTATSAGRSLATREQATTKIHRMLALSEHRPTTTQVLAYYHAHAPQYVIPEQRYFDIKSFYTEPEAKKFRHEVEAGTSLAKTALHESLEQPTSTHETPEEQATSRDIFAVKPNTLSGPILVQGEHSIFVVTRIVPLGHVPFAQAAGAIRSQLEHEQQKRTLARFVREWRARWIPRTDCLPGFVIQKCRQYSGPRVAEDPLSLN